VHPGERGRIADDREANATVANLIEECGFAAMDIGGLAEAAPMEAPRRGAVYGEEYRLPDALKYVEALRRHQPPPPLPDYYSRA
jgi:hypothetical protein